MKVVINVNFGGFSLPKEFCEKYNVNRFSDISRTDKRLVDFVESHDNCVKVRCGKLVVVKIPENATDYTIFEYDGAETVYYALDGKIYEA